MAPHTETVDAVMQSLDTGPKGLSSAAAEQRLREYGPNALRETEPVSPLHILFAQLNSFIVYILIGAVAVSIMLAEYIDSCVIAVILVINTVLGFFQEFRAEKAIETLKKMAELRATVIRDGVRQRIESERVVPGDIIAFEAGDAVPADARICESAMLESLESALTGESVPVRKQTDPVKDTATLGGMTNMVFSGTSITNGAGKAVVVATGMNTEIGSIAESIDAVVEDRTPLQKSLDTLGRRLGVLTLLICGAVIGLGIVRGGAVLEIVMVGVSLAVAAIPEGLPVVVTIALAIGVRKMAKRNALIKRLPGVETLGCTTVICTDKTGTLTKNEMTVVRLYCNRTTITVTGTGYGTAGEFLTNGEPASRDALLPMLACGVVNSDAALDGESVVGDPTEGALLVSAAKAGIDIRGLREENPRIDEIPFDSSRKRKSTVHETNDGPVMYMKGAPDVVLQFCDRVLLDGRPRPLSPDMRDEILAANTAMASEAIRVLAFAFRTVPDGTATEDKLVFMGLQGMTDPPRGAVKDAIAECRNAGIRPIMITGDYVLTARAVAARLGIEGEAMSGEELEGLDDDALVAAVGRTSIFARVNPDHKIRIVRSLRGQGEVVAMSGDGVNDAPAIKEADIGVAMGVTGTDVTRETADMILTDDSYTSIVGAVEQGRAIYENIRKFVNYLLSSNLGEVLILFVAMIIGFRDAVTGAVAVPLIATQILWLNLVTDGLPAIALGADPVRPGIMNRPPRDAAERIVNRDMVVSIVTIAVLMAGTVLYLFNHYLADGVATARTVSFTAIVFLELVRVTMIRAQYRQGFFSNPLLLGALLLSMLLQAAVVYLPFMNTIFSTVPLGIGHWLHIAAAAAVMAVAGLSAVFLINAAAGRRRTSTGGNREALTAGVSRDRR